MSIITVSNLTKSFQAYNRREGVWGAMQDLVSRTYHEVKAVDNINFSVEEGELLGYIGPNGAGKSTSIKMLTGILKPTSGTVRVMGFDPFSDRKRYALSIGVVFGQRTQLWWDIAVIESLRLLGRIYRVDDALFEQRLEMLIPILDIGDVLKTPARKLSLGQRMRCDLAASLLHMPKVLFLDEPTIGLDVVGKDSIRAFLRKINKDLGTTIILTTHDLKEIEELCQRIVVLDKGRVLYDGSLSRIKALPGLHRKLRIEFPGDAPLARMSELFGDRIVLKSEGSRIILGEYDPSRYPTGELLKLLLSSFDVAELSVIEPDIDEVIVKLYREGIATPRKETLNQKPQASI